MGDQCEEIVEAELHELRLVSRRSFDVCEMSEETPSLSFELRERRLIGREDVAIRKRREQSAS